MNVKNMMYAAAALVAGFSGVATSATAVGPICDTAARVGSTTYYSCSGSSHTALDMSNGTCNEWNHRGMLQGDFNFKFFGGCGTSCTGGGCNGGAGNYYVVSGANGWDFRQLHVNANHNSFTKVCNGCTLGLVGSTGDSTGAHVHADNRQYGTRKSAWYVSAGTTCGSSAYCGNVIGSPTL